MTQSSAFVRLALLRISSSDRTQVRVEALLHIAEYSLRPSALNDRDVVSFYLWCLVQRQCTS